MIQRTFVSQWKSKLVYTTKVGQLRVLYVDEEWKNTELILENIQYISGFWIDIFLNDSDIKRLYHK